MRGKWTPGPWFMSGVRQRVGGNDTHSIVATVDGKEINIASVWYNPRTHEGYHDARLMAGAPALYEALLTTRALVSEGASEGFTDHAWMERLFHNQAAISQALAQALGETP